MFWENYVSLCRIKGESPNCVAKRLSISSGTVSGWKSGRSPQNVNLQKIADYFGVSVDYLLSDATVQSVAPSPMSDDDLKFALFGNTDAPDAALAEVISFANYVKGKYGVTRP